MLLIVVMCFFRVAQAYVNQRKLDHEVKTLQVQASQFSKQTAQWISMVEGFNQALKVRTASAFWREWLLLQISRAHLTLCSPLPVYKCPCEWLNVTSILKRFEECTEPYNCEALILVCIRATKSRLVLLKL